MSTGHASLMLAYPEIAWRRRRYYDKNAPSIYVAGKRVELSQWRKLIRLCTTLKRTGAEYTVEYLDMGKHCRALVKWTARRQPGAGKSGR